MIKQFIKREIKWVFQLFLAPAVIWLWDRAWQPRFVMFGLLPKWFGLIQQHVFQMYLNICFIYFHLGWTDLHVCSLSDWWSVSLQLSYQASFIISRCTLHVFVYTSLVTLYMHLINCQSARPVVIYTIPWTGGANLWLQKWFGYFG